MERKERQRKCEETWITLRWAIKTLEETEEEWKIDFKERKKVTRKERKKKYKKKELFKRIIAEVREKVDKIEESEEPEVDETSSEDSLISPPYTCWEPPSGSPSSPPPGLLTSGQTGVTPW